jgi:hypothetical protein
MQIWHKKSNKKAKKLFFCGQNGAVTIFVWAPSKKGKHRPLLLPGKSLSLSPATTPKHYLKVRSYLHLTLFLY